MPRKQRPTSQRIHRPRSAEQQADERRIRDLYADSPTIEQLEATGSYTPSLPREEFFALKNIAAALRNARETAGLSLADMADRTGMDRSSISKLENGVYQNPTINTLSRYASALDLQIQLVLVGKDATT